MKKGTKVLIGLGLGGLALYLINREAEAGPKPPPVPPPPAPKVPTPDTIPVVPIPPPAPGQEMVTVGLIPCGTPIGVITIPIAKFNADGSYGGYTGAQIAFIANQRGGGVSPQDVINTWAAYVAAGLGYIDTSGKVVFDFECTFDFDFD